MILCFLVFTCMIFSFCSSPFFSFFRVIFKLRNSMFFNFYDQYAICFIKQALRLGARHVAKKAARLTLAFRFLLPWTFSILVIVKATI